MKQNSTYRMPTRALILAAGFGERMRPLSINTPKAMMPFAGAPIINHTLSTISQWGVREVVINLHHAPSPLVEHIRNSSFPELHISFSFEPHIRGTGGALRHASWFLGAEPFWIVNSDVVFELDPRALCVEFAKANPLACLWVTSAAGPRTVEVKNNAITSFSAATPGAANTATFCGLHLVSPGILDYIPDTTFSSIVTAYSKALESGKTILAVETSNSYWADIGSPEKLLSCHTELASGARRDIELHKLMEDHIRSSKRLLAAQGVTANGFVSLGSGVTVSRSATLENCIIGNHAAIEANSCVNNCVVADSVTVKGHVSRAVTYLSSGLERHDVRALEQHAWSKSGLLCEALPPRGSDRSFYRVHGASRPAILIKYTTARPENARFARNLDFLASLGVPVPSLFLDLPERNINVVEDLGGTSLQSSYGSMPKLTRDDIYSKVIRFTAILHAKGAHLALARNLELEQPFTESLYKWERELFAKHYLSGILHLDKLTTNMISGELESIPERLNETPVLIHRDLQSSNIMLKAGRPVLIDFQGMRLGSRYYDPASLLLDPYVCLPHPMRRSMTQLYASITGLSADEVYELTHIAGIQRLSQALGAYARLSRLEGMHDFARHIPPARRLLSECLAHTLALPTLAGLVAH